MNSALILFATENELRKLYPTVSHLECGDIKEVECFRGIRIYASVIGVGLEAKENIKHCIDYCSPGCVILAGSAGGISKQVQSGDIVLATSIITESKKIEIEGNALQKKILTYLLKCNVHNVHHGGLFCAKHFVNTKTLKDLIFLETGAIAVDMESIFVAEICNAKGIMFSILKLIIDDNSKTDVANLEEYLNLENSISKDKQNHIVAIHDAIISGVCDMATASFKTYFAYLDILGFKNIVRRNSPEELKDIVSDFFENFSQAIDKSRTMSDGAKINLLELNFRLYSDSILIWAENTRFPVLNNLIQALIELFRIGFKKKLPLRGVLTYGDIIIKRPDSNSDKFFSNEAIYGKALVEAYTKEQKQNWSGCLITEHAWLAMKQHWSRACTSHDTPTCYFRNYPYFVWTKIPTKKDLDSSESIALNWNALGAWNPNKNIAESEILSAFGEEQEIEAKKNNTVNFLHLTNKINAACKNGDTDSIELPPEDYGELKGR